MNIIGELAILSAVCLVAEAISYLLPIAFPSSVISLLMLMLALYTGRVKERHIETTSNFFLSNMGVFFVPACIGLMNHFAQISAQIVPFLVITALTVPLVYGVTAWTVQLMMRGRKKEGTP